MLQVEQKRDKWDYENFKEDFNGIWGIIGIIAQIGTWSFN
jgi:hypothetical protein